jgi:hypothetical protein
LNLPLPFHHHTLPRAGLFLLVLGVALGVGAFFVHVGQYAVNLPIHDDYVAVLDFLDRWQNGSDSKLSLLFQRRNEHLIVFTKLIALAIVGTNGELNFRAMQIFASLALIFIVGLIACTPRTNRGVALFALLILSLWMFRPQQYKMVFYALASVHALWSFAFAAAYLFLVLRPGWMAAAGAGLFLLLALLAGPNGLFLAPIAVSFLILRQQRRGALVHSLIALPLLALSLLSLLRSGMSGESANAMQFVIDHPLVFITFILGLLGGAISVSALGAPQASFLFGACVAVAAIWYLLAAKDVPEDFAKPVILFCLLSCTMIAFGRSLVYADVLPDVAYDGRYVIFSLACVGVLLHRLTLRVQPQFDWVRLALLGVMVLAAIAAYAYEAPLLATTKEARLRKFDAWTLHMDRDFDRRDPLVSTILRSAVCNGIFRRDLSERCRAEVSMH